MDAIVEPNLILWSFGVISLWYVLVCFFFACRQTFVCKSDLVQAREFVALIAVHSMHLAWLADGDSLMRVALSRWEGRLLRYSPLFLCEDLCFSWYMPASKFSEICIQSLDSHVLYQLMSLTVDDIDIMYRISVMFKPSAQW